MWEEVSSNGYFVTNRMKVPGGWLVITCFRESCIGAAVAQTFVADAWYKWKLEDKK